MGSWESRGFCSVLFFFFFSLKLTSDEVMGAKQPLQSPTATVIWNHSDFSMHLFSREGWAYCELLMVMTKRWARREG